MSGPSVVVLGGGVAGMSAAHELVERGFQVRVFETRSDVAGGKARSVVVPSTVPRQNVGGVNLGRLAAPVRRDLPGEHGFRFFPRFYRHIVDTLSRIPYRNTRSVADNLVDTTGTLLARFNSRPITLPTKLPSSMVEIFSAVHDWTSFYGSDLGVAPEDHAFFAERVWEILTTCSERRDNELEKVGWWEFVGAASRSENYRKLYAIGLTRALVAAKAEIASTKTIGNTFVQLLFNLSDPTVSSDRVLNGPTNDVWIDPWLSYLRTRDVEYQLGATVRTIDVEHGRVCGVLVERDGKTSVETADFYVSALPIEVMARLVDDRLIRADPRLADIFPLSRSTAWMNGIQFYLSEDVPIGRGHQIYLDSPWALTSISQRQFWPDVDLSRYGDGSIRGILSVDISDWDAPGLLTGKPARECTRYEIRDEVWEQLKRSLNVLGANPLEDEDLRYWYLDLDVNPVLKSNAEPLLVNLANTWRLRPAAVTAIPNLFLAADYVQTYTDLATMEGANEAARRAVNGILEQSGVSAAPCQIWNLYESEILEPWRAHDRERYRQRLPWDGTLVRLALSALVTLYRGTSVLETAIRDAVGSATHVDDFLTYVRTGESRSQLLQRLTSPGSPAAGGDLLQAFAAFAREFVPPAESASTSTLDVLSSAARGLGGGIRFLEPERDR